MQRWYPQFMTLAVVLLAAFLAKAGDYDISPVGDLDKVPKFQVDPIDPTAKIPNKPPEGVRPSGENKYVACWTWDVAKEPKWRCTEKYADPRDVDDFANYQWGRYKENGYVGKWPVDPKAWDDPEQHKKLMDTFVKEKVPNALEVQAKRAAADGKAEFAAALRKQIQFVQVEWVNVEPVLPKGVKVSDGQPTKKTKVGYDDDVFMPSGVEGTWYQEGSSKSVEYRFLAKGKKLIVLYYGKESDLYSSGKWSQNGNLVKFDVIRHPEKGDFPGDVMWNFEGTIDGKTMKAILRAIRGDETVTTTNWTLIQE